ncbi:hypothetical protein SLITO_v1c00940 [Spiroplasma litorale]|uniref:Uncharacterized protein n=1 Tax=Spiroplasma litorale TaxID=216942 RepID=A0A0K1W104_9MOLU|nr:hypothetical protein [Spiroplasma litorale]AKX33762.1 hypothetical protein SLITO_v1c00940 [Spiroplasma litorale]
MEKLEKETKTNSKNYISSYKNFNNLYWINLKISLKATSIITAGVITSFSIFLLLIVEFASGYSVQKSYASYRDVVYIFITAIVIVNAMVISFYLYKTQNRTGIQAIELRAGYTVFKSFIIRQLVQLTIIVVYLLPLFLLSVPMMFIFNMDSKFYFGTLFSQLFFIIFLGIFSSLIINAIVLSFKTAMAACLSTIFMIFCSITPFVYNLATSVGNLSSGEKQKVPLINLKFKSGSDFYNNFKNDANLSSVFDDNTPENKSKTLDNLNENYNKAADSLAKINPSNNRFKNNDLKTWRVSDNNQLYTYALKKGEIMYNYMLGEDQLTEWNLLSNTSFGKLLIDINETFFKEDIYSNLVKEFKSVTPNIYKRSYNMGQDSNKINVTLNNFIKEIDKTLPQYSGLVNYINKFYLANYDYLILDNKTLIDTISNDSIYNESSWGKESACSTWGEGSKNCNSETINKNDEYKNKYTEYPELTIFNGLFLGLWKNSMIFNIDNKEDVNYSLDDYSKLTKSFSTSSTNIMIHFPMMFSGIFMDSLVDDGLSTQSFLSVSRPVTYIKNLFDYEKQAPENKNKTNNSSLTPLFKDGYLKYSSYFIKGLAFFVYLLVASPLAYLTWLSYRRRARV